MVRCRHCDAGNCAGEGPVADVLFQYRFSRSAGEGPVGAEPDLAKRQQGRAQADVNAFNDFYLINGIGKLKVRFNGQLQNLGQVALPGWLGVPISTALISHLEFMVFGAMIVFFLIVEPHGLARLWSVAKEKLRLWPFPH